MKKSLLTFFIIAIIFNQSYTQTNANEWTWINGSSIGNQAGNYGTKGVPSESNMPGSRRQAATWVCNNKLYLMGGYGYDSNLSIGSLNDLWEYDSVTNNWTWLKGSDVSGQNGIYGTQGIASSINTPGARRVNAKWVYNGKLYLMGGAGSGGCYNDLWEYDPVTNNWTWLKGSNTTNQVGVYGTLGTVSTNNTPGARQDGFSWTYNNKFYLMGGFNFSFGSPSYSFNDLWEYDPVTNNWRWIKGSNGTTQNGIYGIKGVSASTNVPGSRSHSFVWVNENKAYIFGGSGSSEVGGGYLADFWEYNHQTNNWTWISGSKVANFPGNPGTKGVPSSSNFIGSREGDCSWVFNNKLFLMGGYGNISTYNDRGERDDVWEYNLNTQNWTWLKGTTTFGSSGVYGTKGVSSSLNNPSGRTYNTGWFDNDKYYMFSGENSNNGSIFNDLWLYTPTCTEMTTVSSGDWNDANTWSCKRIPTATDDVTINGHTISIMGNCFAKKVIKESGAIVNVATGGNLKIGNP